MCNLPVESLQTGGLLWFPDLTAADPYFIFPVACALTMLLTIEVVFIFLAFIIHLLVPLTQNI